MKNEPPEFEWASYEEYEQLYQAASRLVTAIGYELPVGACPLIEKECDAVMKVLYQKEGGK